MVDEQWQPQVGETVVREAHSFGHRPVIRAVVVQAVTATTATIDGVRYSSRGALPDEMLGPPVGSWSRRWRILRATPELLAKAAESSARADAARLADRIADECRKHRFTLDQLRAAAQALGLDDAR